ncbi:hypothetical protein ACJ73_09329, partial [Blastomyces percursus]
MSQNDRHIAITPASLRLAKKRQHSTLVATDCSSQETPRGPGLRVPRRTPEYAQQRQKPQQQQRQSCTNHGPIF